MNGVLIGNVSNHEGRSWVVSNVHRVNIKDVWIVVPGFFFDQDIISIRNGVMIDVSIRVVTDVNSGL
jgi:hypothetical protein